MGDKRLSDKCQHTKATSVVTYSYLCIKKNKNYDEKESYTIITHLLFSVRYGTE